MHHNIASILITPTISRTEGIYLCSVLNIMASARRNTIWINVVRIPLQLKELVSRVPETSSFTKRYGRLLNLVTSSFDEKMMGVLFQFFDPKNHCFTFPDYQLVPTLVEFAQLLDIPILEQLPFTCLEEVPKPKVIASALHLKRADVVSNWETRNESKVFYPNFW